MKLRPIGSDVLVHPIDVPAKTSSGLLHIPDTARLSRRTNQGILVAFGPSCEREGLAIGDHVLFNPYTGDKVPFASGGIFYTIPESHIVGVIENSNVILFDSMTVKRIINERFGELNSLGLTSVDDITRFLNGIESSLIDRINSFTTHEGLEWIFIFLFNTQVILNQIWTF